MLAVKLLSTAFLLGTTVLADGAAIVAAMDVIAQDTANLDAAVSSWNGGILGALPITIKSTQLLNDINAATKVAKESAPLTDAETISVAGATLGLAQDVNQTLTTIIAAKPKFDHVLLSPVTLLNLGLEKKATDEFGAAVVEKVPAGLQDAAKSLIAQIDASFDQAIDVYNGPF